MLSTRLLWQIIQTSQKARLISKYHIKSTFDLSEEVKIEFWLFTCVFEKRHLTWISKYNLCRDAALPIARLFGDELLLATKCVTVICLFREFFLFIEVCGLIWGSCCFHTCILYVLNTLATVSQSGSLCIFMLLFKII